ncbi:hypothetical protein [Derxia gummosa]|uniref:Uncharacterized protein n=1 Tax=Derxia gummosa DSM 723 TaxID=1121388 RepID=A0A8B6XAC1_9BURK|nr:hypothetical protein [Derxia gummosa]
MNKLIAALALSLAGLGIAQASALPESLRTPNASSPDYTVFHDAPTGFVFVKLPTGWKFVGKADKSAAAPSDLHTVFHDAGTEFVFVRMPEGWKFVGRADTAI